MRRARLGNSTAAGVRCCANGRCATSAAKKAIVFWKRAAFPLRSTIEYSISRTVIRSRSVWSPTLSIKAASKRAATAPFQLQDAPDVVRLLVAHLVEEIPTATHRAALEACALVRWTTESLLAHLLELEDGGDESAALFEWLHSLSFIESGAQGLCAHDLAREALAANLRWRNPQAHERYHRRARAFYREQLKRASVSEQQKVLADYIYLHHDNAVIRPFLEWQENGDLSSTAASENDLPILREIVNCYEGAESARLFEYWFARQRENVLVLRGHDTQIEGFLFALALHQASEEERENDAAAFAAWNCLQNAAPLRRGEGRDDVSLLDGARRLSKRIAPAKPDFYQYRAPLLDDARFGVHLFSGRGRRFLGADFRLCAFDALARSRLSNWRKLLWCLRPRLAIDAAHGVARQAGRKRNRRHAFSYDEARIEYSKRDACAHFAERKTSSAVAVRDALKNLARPAILETNPLLRSRLILERASNEAATTEAATLSSSQKTALLQKVLRASCESLNASGRTEKWFQSVALALSSNQPRRKKPPPTKWTFLSAPFGAISNRGWNA